MTSRVQCSIDEADQLGKVAQQIGILDIVNVDAHVLELAPQFLVLFERVVDHRHDVRDVFLLEGLDAAECKDANFLGERSISE